MSIETNAQVLSLTEEEIEEIVHFHKTLFLKVMKAVRKCFTYDKIGSVDGYFVVPLKKSKSDSDIFAIRKMTIILL